MNRRSFFKFLGIGAAAAVVAPKVLAGKPSKIEYTVDDWEWTPIQTHVNRSIDDLTIFEEPHEGYDYSIGVETGDGLGGSPSVVSVMRVGKGDEPCEQVAEFSSSHHNGAQLVPIVAQIARKYGEKCIDPRGPLLVIEQVQAPGDTVQWQLKIMGFTRFHSAKYHTKDKKNRDITTDKEGWYTTKFSGPIMMDRFKEAVKEGFYKPKSVKLTRYDSMRVQNKELRSNPYFMAAAQSYVGCHSFSEVKRNA